MPPCSIGAGCVICERLRRHAIPPAMSSGRLASACSSRSASCSGRCSRPAVKRTSVADIIRSAYRPKRLALALGVRRQAEHVGRQRQRVGGEGAATPAAGPSRVPAGTACAPGGGLLRSRASPASARPRASRGWRRASRGSVPPGMVSARFMCGVPGWARTARSSAPGPARRRLNSGQPRRSSSSASVDLPVPLGAMIATTPSGESTAAACSAS